MTENYEMMNISEDNTLLGQVPTWGRVLIENRGNERKL